MKRVVVCGATSMIGLSLIEECIKNGTQVLAIIRKNSQKKELLPKSNLIEIFECDISELKETDIQNYGFDCFYHLMWLGTTGEERNDKDLQMKNVSFCLDALRLAKRIGCKKFVGAGSQAEYGAKEEILSEKTETDPVTEYGKAKLLAYKQCAEVSQRLNLEFVWVRILSVYGKNDGKNTLITTLIRKLKNGETVELTPCEQIWDYLYSEDAGKAFYLIGQKGKDKSVYVLGSGKAMPLKEYVEIVKNKIDKNANIIYGAVPYRKDQIMHLKADINPLQKDTGWKPEIEFHEGIDRMLQG